MHRCGGLGALQRTQWRLQPDLLGAGAFFKYQGSYHPHIQSFGLPRATCCVVRLIAVPVQVEDTVRGFSNIDNLALFNLEGSGLVGVVGAASKLFACLHRGTTLHQW